MVSTVRAVYQNERPLERRCSANDNTACGYGMLKAFSTTSIKVFKYPVQHHNIY